jgi:branched-chain amino acid transport system substrate-binding protein
MKIGVLYPRSNAHPGIMVDFVEGIKTALQQQQLDKKIQLISESIGFGGNEKEVYEKMEKLLLLERADVIAAFVDLRILEIIKPLIYASGKLVLIINAGANYPENWVPQSNILYLNLQHSFLCWLTGKLAVQTNENKAATATTFYDCGYLHTAAMVKSFVNEGGTISYNYINNQRYDDAFEIKSLTDYLSSDKETTNLLCVFDSLPAALFYSRLKTYVDIENLHLFVSPMMLEQKALENLKDGFKSSIDGHLPWHISLENMANKNFIDYYLQQTEREACIFSLLGWEAGLVFNEIYLRSNGKYSEGDEIAGKLTGVKINSPRGEMKLDAETNHFIAPVYRCSVQHKSNKLSIQIIENTENEWKTFVAIPTEGVSSGWTNTYLCY